MCAMLKHIVHALQPVKKPFLINVHRQLLQGTLHMQGTQLFASAQAIGCDIVSHIRQASPTKHLQL